MSKYILAVVDVYVNNTNLQDALLLGVCTAAASLSEVSASDGVGTVKEVLKLYDVFN